VTLEGDEFAAHDPSLPQRFAAALGSSAILTDNAVAPYMRDGQSPRVVALPTNAAQVAVALALAAELSVAVMPWGGGTQMSFGFPLTQADVVLTMERMRRIQIHGGRDPMVTVHAGCTVTDLRQALAEHRRFLPLDGPLPERATIGGRLATGLPGWRRQHDGHPREWIDHLVLARSDGTVLHTNGVIARHMSAQTLGYDLDRIIVGSLGTLGVIVEATLRTLPQPDDEGVALVPLVAPEAVRDVLAALDRAQISPVAAILCGPGTLALRDSDLTHAGMFPLLAVRLAGPAPVVERERAALLPLLASYGIATPGWMQMKPMHALWSRLDNWNAMDAPEPGEALLKVAALPLDIASVVDLARTLCSEHGITVQWMADALTGIVWLRMKLEGTTPEIAEAFEHALGYVQHAMIQRWRDALLVSATPDIRKGFPLWGADPQNVQLLRALKPRFDPKGILNPGRLGGA
jgi:glycolate oxidase FAD binding subunit